VEKKHFLSQHYKFIFATVAEVLRHETDIQKNYFDSDEAISSESDESDKALILTWT
jgi:hypothetical protein